MPKSSISNLEDFVVFTQAVENVFRRLIRILVGRISLLKLQEMMNFIYVEEAEFRLKKKSPGKNIPLTKIALMTGFDTRTVVSIRARIEQSGSQYGQRVLKDLTPESAIVEAWVNEISSAPEQKKNRRTLTYGGDHSDFEKLFRRTIASRGITSRSIIQSLVAAKNIEHDKKKKTITLVVNSFSPYLSDDEPQNFNAAFTAISNLISSIENNIGASSEDKLFQRQVWTFHLPRTAQLNFRKKFRNFLQNIEQKARKEMETWEVAGDGDELMTAGVGFYYFEEAK